jgi:hypothetical protein
LINPETLEDLRCLASPFPSHSDKEMFGADELILESVSLGGGILEQLHDARGGINLRAFISHLGALLQNFFHPLSHLFGVYSELLQYLAG